MFSLPRSVLALALLASSFVASAETLLISAAASLTNAFQQIAKDYQQQQPDTQIQLNFAASGILLQQVAKGAPVDILATADQDTMDKAASQQLIVLKSRQDFAENQLVLAVPSQSTLNFKQINDLTSVGQKLAIGQPDSVPAGHYAKIALEQAKLWQALQPKLIFTQNVRQALDYVSRGEVDAGVVYYSDVIASKGKVRQALKLELPTPIRYPIAIVAASSKATASQAFITYLQSDRARKILSEHGFQ